PISTGIPIPHRAQANAQRIGDSLLTQEQAPPQLAETVWRDVPEAPPRLLSHRSFRCTMHIMSN
ncbi:MAG TPA: hypothetical protein PLI78_08360, partial [Dokdonella sp.]|nr:hypothetical protein [Dokdonella sp.]